jgi:hypothetical protein
MLHQEDDAEHEHATPHVDYQYGFDMVFCRRAIRILRISLPALWSWDGFWLAVFVFMVRPSRPHGNRLLDNVFEPFPNSAAGACGSFGTFRAYIPATSTAYGRCSRRCSRNSSST